MEKNYSNYTNKEKKYRQIFNRDLAITLQTLTGQKPYVFKDLLHEGKIIWSFINNEEFKEAFNVVMGKIAKGN